MKKVILVSACFLSSIAFSQESSNLKKQITQKETELTNVVNSSRQVNNSIKAELNKLYVAYKSELETQLKSITDKILLAKKKEELKLINKKIENYSLQK